MRPLVSILIPAYNAERWLAETLKSAVAQTWSPKEIIVVDDGSKDETPRIGRGFESAGVQVVTQDNQGAAAARNKAFSLSTGQYIQWLDADDLLAPDKIAKQMEVILSNHETEKLVSGAWGRFMYRPYRAKFSSTPLWNDLSPVEWLMRKMEHNVYMQTATWLVSREITEAAGPWDTRLLGDDDGEYFCRALLASKGTCFVPDSKVFYRMAGSGSLSHIGSSNRKRDAQWLSMKLTINCLRSLDDSARARAACLKYLQTWMVYFYPERMDIFCAAESLAQQLGGALVPPPMSWKYSWIDAAFGRKHAKRTQMVLSGMRWSMERFRDKALFAIHRSVGVASARTERAFIE